jgi:uncharacterized protein YjcR
MKSHSEIVAAADAGSIARMQGVSIHTVRSWAQRNSIPAQHWPAFTSTGYASIEELVAGVKPRKDLARCADRALAHRNSRAEGKAAAVDETHGDAPSARNIARAKSASNSKGAAPSEITPVSRRTAA